MNHTYVVLIINLLIWIGIFSFIFSTNKEIKRVTKRLDQLSK